MASKQKIIVKNYDCRKLLGIISKGGTKPCDGSDDFVFSFYTCDSIVFDGSYSSQANTVYITDYSKRVVQHFRAFDEFRAAFDSALSHGFLTRSFTFHVLNTVKIVDIKKMLCSTSAFIKPSKVDGENLNDIRIFDILIPVDKMDIDSILSEIKLMGVVITNPTKAPPK